MGIDITRYFLVFGGAAVLVLLAFQVLQGKRKITFKGKLHMKVHRGVAYALVALSILHALAAMAFLGFI